MTSSPVPIPDPPLTPVTSEQAVVADGVGGAVIGMYVNLIRAAHVWNHGFELQQRAETGPLAAELMRTNVVMYHAAFEDFVRTVLRYVFPARLPNLPANQRNYPFSDHTGRIIDQVKLEQWVGRHSISTIEVLKRDLERLGMDPSAYQPHFDTLAWMMDRRHKIVHEGDLVQVRPPRLRLFVEADLPHLSSLSETLKAFTAQLSRALSSTLRVSDWKYIASLVRQLEETQEGPGWVDAPHIEMPSR